MRTTSVLLTLALMACGDSGTEPSIEELLATAAFDVIAGADQADTIQARLQPIVLRLADASARAVPGVGISFVLLEPDCGSLFAGFAVTDANGQAAELWDLGTVAKDCTLEARAVDPDGTPRVFATVSATVEPGRPVSLDLTAPDHLWVGTPISLSSYGVTGVDRHGNQMVPTVTWDASGVGRVADGMMSADTEGYAWMVGVVGSLRDSVEVPALYDLTTLDGWRYERWHKVFHSGGRPMFDACGAHPGVDGEGDYIDSLHVAGVVQAVAYTTRPDGALSGQGERTVWCQYGNVLVEQVELSEFFAQDVHALRIRAEDLASPAGLPRDYRWEDANQHSYESLRIWQEP